MNLVNKIRDSAYWAYVKVWDGFDWHKDFTEDFIEKYDIAIYTACWLAFVQGVFWVLFLQWIL